jgi:hypothetical protein
MFVIPGPFPPFALALTTHYPLFSCQSPLRDLSIEATSETDHRRAGSPCSVLTPSSTNASCARATSNFPPRASFDICAARYRFHDLRHQAITELAESTASDSTIMSIAGHVSRKMLAHYSHVRLDAKRNALDALTMGRGKQADSERTSKGYDTNHDTNVPSSLPFMPQIVESLVELSGIEPLTSSLRTRRSPS